MRELCLSEEAIEDLHFIWQYTAHVWSENQANKYHRELMSTCQQLVENPFLIGQWYERYHLFGMRSGKHIIFYRQTETTIIVFRILHSSMDFKRHLHIIS